MNIKKEILSLLKDLPLTQESVCSCGSKIRIPILWNDYFCEVCGHHVLLTPNVTRTIAQRLLVAAGMEPELIGLSIGDPQSIPAGLIKTLREEVGRNFAFVRLNGKFKFDCVNCGKCCKHALNSKKAYFANLSEEEALRIFGDAKLTRLPLNEITKTCIFWDTKNYLCKIHEKRPTFCRLFPLQTFGIELDKKRVRFLTWIPSPCPGVGQGKTWTVHQFLKAGGVLHKFT